MELHDIIDGINTRRMQMGMTIQQLADAAQSPESSVKRVLRHETETPPLSCF